MLKLIIILTAAAALAIVTAGNVLAESEAVDGAVDGEDASNVEISEVSVTQFPCRSWETTYTCTLRALREEVLHEKTGVLRFV